MYKKILPRVKGSFFDLFYYRLIIITQILFNAFL